MPADNGKELTAGQALLENAYDLHTPKDNIDYYAKLAAHYDADFANGLGYDYPAAVADVYNALASEQDVPVADIGCGTGLVAQSLKVKPSQLHGFDISEHMLNIARSKALYAQLHTVDLTKPIQAIKTRYAGFVSAGTFTHGHLGPEPLLNLLGIAHPGALYVIGVNKKHFEKHEFARFFDRLQKKSQITRPEISEVPIYSSAQHEHAEDRAFVVSFRQLT